MRRNARRSVRDPSSGRYSIRGPAAEPSHCRRRRGGSTTTSAVVYDDELLLEVERLNIDSASFVQMEGQGDVAAQILETVRTRGKQHNPVTGSGGMLLGRVARVGSALAADAASPLATLEAGDRVATLVSLTLTPLRLDRIVSVDPERHQVVCAGQAVLFASGMAAKMPADLPEPVALAALRRRRRRAAGDSDPSARRRVRAAGYARRACAHPRLRRQVGPAHAARRRGAPALGASSASSATKRQRRARGGSAPSTRS